MNVKQILKTVCVIALVLPMLASAEIYKWKDKNGVMRYSDTPPPASVQVNTLGKKSTASPVRPDNQSEVGKESSKPDVAIGNKPLGDFKDPPADPELEAARVRAKNAEIEKTNKLAAEKTAKINAENCKSARANYQSFAQGGRIYKMNEKGEREYMDDAGLEAGKAKAQAEMNKYCK